MEQTGWQETHLATSAIKGAFVRWCEPQNNRFAGSLEGCETTHQLGLWTSESQRLRGLYRLGDRRDYVPLQRVSYVPADVPWTAHIDDHGIVKSALFCDFEADYFRDVVGVDIGEAPFCQSMASPLLMQGLSLLLDEVRNPGFSHEITVDALCRVALVEVGRCFRRDTSFAVAGGKGKLAHWQVERIREYVESVEGRPIAIDEIADVCGLSSAHLRRVFKATTGLPIGAFVEQIRFERAKSLLREKDLRLKQIAYTLGFANPGAFSKAFHRHAGISPSAFRQMHSGPVTRLPRRR